MNPRERDSSFALSPTFYGEALTVSIALGTSLALLGILLVNRTDHTSPADADLPSIQTVLDPTTTRTEP